MSAEETHTGVAAAQRIANLALKFVYRLDGVPAGCPEEGLQRARRLARGALHGVGKS